MSMFRFLWLRRLVRRHTTPIPYRKAHKFRNYLSIAYALCAWNMLGFIFWEYSKGRGTKESYGIKNSELDMLSPAQQFALASGIEKAKIIRSSNPTETLEFKLEDYAHLIKKPGDNTTNTTTADDDDDDEDNVA